MSTTKATALNEIPAGIFPVSSSLQLCTARMPSHLPKNNYAHRQECRCACTYKSFYRSVSNARHVYPCGRTVHLPTSSSTATSLVLLFSDGQMAPKFPVGSHLDQWGRQSFDLPSNHVLCLKQTTNQTFDTISIRLIGINFCWSVRCWFLSVLCL